MGTEQQIAEYRIMLRKIRRQLNSWADESINGGWSTHQVKPQRELAAQIQQLLDATQ